MTKLALRDNRISPQMLYWETEKGIGFLKKVGVKAGDTVLDFGCRVGHYTIPAAKTVGSKGVVYAIDIQDDALTELKQKQNTQKLKNIRIIKTSGQLNLPLEDKSIDIVLFYDILHYLKESDRKKLYQEAFRVLKQNGLLSFYPKHCLEDNPIMEFQDMNLEGVKREIQDSNFVFSKQHCGFISHDDGLNQGCVLNFRKSGISFKI